MSAAKTMRILIPELGRSVGGMTDQSVRNIDVPVQNGASYTSFRFFRLKKWSFDDGSQFAVFGSEYPIHG